MRHVIASAPTPERQLALDEAMLLEADESGAGEQVRFWEFDRPVVVLGRSSKIDVEVDREFCRESDIPVLRRCSGGASVVGGPGCLMYSVVLSFDERPEVQRIDAAHRFVMGRIRHAVQQFVPEVVMQGTCDLTWRNRKFSGNSLRIAKRHLLYHGTVLYAADVDLISRCLATAPRQPDYRDGRDHSAFITNLPLNPTLLREAIRDSFFAVCGKRQPVAEPGRSEESGVNEALVRRSERLYTERYSQPQWHERH